MTDTQAIDVVTFDFKGTRVRSLPAALLIIKWIILGANHFEMIKVSIVKI